MMSPQTNAAIRALLAADTGMSAEERTALLDALEGKPATVTAAPAPMPSVLSAAETSRLTNLSPRSLRTYARRGLIKPCYYAGSTRAWGYHADSVRNFIASATK